MFDVQCSVFDVFFVVSNPKEIAEKYLRIAYEHQMAGRLNEAVEGYTRSIEAHPTAEAYTFRGWAYSFLGRISDAIEVDPEFGNPYNDIGAYLIELGRFEEAIPWLEKATRAARYDPRHFPHFNLARIYLQIYEYGKARMHLRKSLELEPGYDAAHAEMAKLIARLN